MSAERLAELLADTVRAFEYLGHPALIERFVLRNASEARRGEMLPRGIRYGAQKQCFKNATHLVSRRPQLEYVEGFVLAGGLPMAIHHGWCVDALGRVIDNTLKDAPDNWYLGVTFRRSVVGEEIARSGTYGLLDSGRGVNHALMFRLDPELEPIAREVMERRKANAAQS